MRPGGIGTLYYESRRASESVTVPEGERKVTRYKDVVCPRRIWMNTPRVSVVVCLTVQRLAYSVAVEEMVVHEHLPVQVRIEAPLFDILNAPLQEITIVPDNDSAPLVFDLRPRQVSHTDITLDFFQNGDPVGTATVAVEVIPYVLAEGDASCPVCSIQIESGIVPPDLVLGVGWNQHGSTLAQQWLRDTTNREKAEYFKRYSPELSGTRMPEDVSVDFFTHVMSRDLDSRDFVHPFWWAAFYLTGV